MADPPPLSPHRVRRRDVLKGLGFGALLAACQGRATAATTTAVAATSTTSTRPGEVPIDTVVVVMLENRSFDHHFGHLAGVDGLAGRQFSNDGVATHHLEDACTERDLDHSFDGSHAQWNDGRNDGFVARSGAEAMGYRLPEDLPFTSALAREFTVCDRWFCSVLGPTFPNRHYLHSGTSDGRTYNEVSAFPKPSIWDRLDDASIPWAYWYGDLPFLGLYPAALGRGLARNRVGALSGYFEAAKDGRLPAVSFVEPTFDGALATDDHPPHNSQLAQRFVAQVFGALAASPHWERSLFLLTYDEHGGFFDHVPPPAVVDDFAASGFGHTGFRVPAVLAGPFVRRHHVSSVAYDHTSLLRFLEWRFGLPPLAVRDAQAANLLDALDFTRADATVPRLPLPEPDPATSKLCAPAPPPSPAGTGRQSAGSLHPTQEGDGMALLREVVPPELRGNGDGVPAEPTHPHLVRLDA